MKYGIWKLCIWAIICLLSVAMVFVISHFGSDIKYTLLGASIFGAVLLGWSVLIIYLLREYTHFPDNDF